MNTHSTHKNIKGFTRNTALLVTLLILLSYAVPGLASDGYAIGGNFVTFADGVSRGYEIEGFAVMVRTADDKTIVSTHVSGLAANTTYGVHVHNKPCSDSNGGVHYQNVVGGAVDQYNEIWPAFTTNSAGIGNGTAVHQFYARPEAQSVVVHDTDGKRIACADLE